MSEVNSWEYSNPNLLGQGPQYQARIMTGPGGLQVIQDATQEYGIGITLPLTPDEHSPYGMKLAYSTAQAVQSDLINLILTQKGERYDNKDFGTNLHKFLFRQNTPEVVPLIEEEIRNAITMYETETEIGVNIHSINISRVNEDGREGHGLTIAIKYSVLGNAQEILATLMGRADLGGPVFSSYTTTGDNLWNYGSPLQLDADGVPYQEAQMQQIDNGFDDDEFII